MAKQIKAGTINVSVTIRIIDSTDGTPETSVTSATGGLALEYRREGAVSVGLTESDLSLLTDAHSDGGMLHIGNGYYRVDIPDAATAAGVIGVLVHGVATGMVIIGEYLELVSYDPFDTVRLGLTSLPNAVVDAAGGLPISDLGGLDLDQIASDTAAILVDTGELQADWTNGGRLDLIIDLILADTAELQTDLTDGGRLDLLIDLILGDTAELQTDWFNGGRLDLILDIIAADVVNLDGAAMRGTDSAALASALVTVDTVVDGIQTDLDNATDGLGALKTLIDAIKAETVNILVDTAVIGAAGVGLSDLGGMSTGMKAEVLVEVNAALDTAISELGVAVPATTPTLRTALMLLYMALRNKTIVQTSGTDALEVHNDAGTLITKKLLTDDGSDYSEAKMS